MGIERTDRTEGRRRAVGRSADAPESTPEPTEGVERRGAIAAAIAAELDERDDSREFSADELRTAARGVVDAVGPEAAGEIRGWARGLLELLETDEDELEDRYAAMVAWRMVERFDERRGRNRGGPESGGEGSPVRTVFDESGQAGSVEPPELPPG